MECKHIRDFLTNYGRNKIKIERKGILLSKLFWPTVRKKCSCDPYKILEITWTIVIKTLRNVSFLVMQHAKTMIEILLPILFWPTVRKNWTIFKIFEMTRTIYSNSEKSEQFLVTEYFFNLLMENKLEQLEFKFERNIGI